MYSPCTKNTAVPTGTSSDSTVLILYGNEVTHSPLAVWIVFRNDTAIASTGFTTITTFPLTLRFLSSASVDNAEITLYNSPATTSPRSLGANVNVPDDSLSVTAPLSSSLSFISPIGSD